MKHILFLALLISLLTSCLDKNKCLNQFEFSTCKNDSIPILNLDITKHPDTIRAEMNKLYGLDLCKKCSRVDFRLPFEIEKQKGFLKVRTDFNSPVCGNCPTYVRLRHYFSIMVNQKNQLLVEGELTQLDSLQPKIERYLTSVGVEEMAPENFEKINFSILWSQDSDK